MAEQKNTQLPSMDVRIDKMMDYGESKIKAFASVNIGNAFAIHGIRVIDSSKGMFVAMPQESYTKNGKTQYSDLFHAVTAEARNALNHAVLQAYQQQVQATQQEPQQNAGMQQSY